MAFVLLIVEDPTVRRSRPPEEGQRSLDRMLKFSADLEARGVLKVSQSLRGDAEGVRISTRGGKRTTVDGPFTESKEIVGGFFYLECNTKAEALAIANECPAVEWATVEIREIGPCWEGNG